jgi:hypothetical protein
MQQQTQQGSKAGSRVSGNSRMLCMACTYTHVDDAYGGHVAGFQASQQNLLHLPTSTCASTPGGAHSTPLKPDSKVSEKSC